VLRAPIYTRGTIEAGRRSAQAWDLRVPVCVFETTNEMYTPTAAGRRQLADSRPCATAILQLPTRGDSGEARTLQHAAGMLDTACFHWLSSIQLQLPAGFQEFSSERFSAPFVWSGRSFSVARHKLYIQCVEHQNCLAHMLIIKRVCIINLPKLFGSCFLLENPIDQKHTYVIWISLI
jgi:hypothetical protein